MLFICLLFKLPLCKGKVNKVSSEMTISKDEIVKIQVLVTCSYVVFFHQLPECPAVFTGGFCCLAYVAIMRNQEGFNVGRFKV